MKKLYNVSSSPHIRSRLSTERVMCDVILALMPAGSLRSLPFWASCVSGDRGICPFVSADRIYF